MPPSMGSRMGWEAAVHGVQRAVGNLPAAVNLLAQLPAGLPARPTACHPAPARLQAERCDRAAAIEAALKQAFEAADQEIVEEAVSK